MARIQVLDKGVAELIAAGEVVERPASVVKELVENAIDAGATGVTLEIKAGGVEMIRLTDNGSGILREDIPKAFLRHATSKVREAADLESILTLGFRGEALASIAAMCRVELTTRTKDEEEGTTCTVEGGEVLELAPAGCPVGTTITVRDIFYNTPARMKFLKKDITEGNAVAQVVEKCALSHPEVAFRFIRDGQVRLRTSGNGDLLSVIYSVYSREFAGDMLAADYTLDGIRVSGYISKPGAVKPSRTYQNFFINGRYVRTRTASAALEEAYKNKIMGGKFPACVLNIELDAGVVDVNVHPAKTEVRFTNERPVFSAVFFAVKAALAGLEQPIVQTDPPKAETGRVTPLTLHQPQEEYVQQTMTAQEFRSRYLKEEPAGKADYSRKLKLSASRAEDALPMGGEEPLKKTDVTHTEKPSGPAAYTPRRRLDIFVEDEPEAGASQGGERLPVTVAAPLETGGLGAAGQKGEDALPVERQPQQAEPQQAESKQAEEDFRLVGEVFGTYILLEAAKGLLLVDKHAAHERMKYEELKENISYGNRQVLLAPLPVTLSSEDYTAVADNPGALEEMGFLVEDFGSNTVLVRETPIELGEGDIAFLVADIAARMRENHRDLTPHYLDRLYYSIACKSAIRAGDKNSPAELEELVRRLAQNPQITHCPHGRPVSVRLTRGELEKMFGRIV